MYQTSLNMTGCIGTCPNTGVYAKLGFYSGR